jgi:hypothetical protein
MNRSIAFYSIQRAQAGRRSGHAGEMDVMSAAARLRSHVSIGDLAAPVGDENAEDITWHGTLVASRFGTSPARAGVRNNTRKAIPPQRKCGLGPPKFPRK